MIAEISTFIYASSESALIEILAPIVGPGLVFFAIYYGVYLYYRNTNARYAYESHSSVEVRNMKMYDRKTGSVSGVKNSRIAGDNSKSHTKRLRR
jgi:hypothetical protein